MKKVSLYLAVFVAIAVLFQSCQKEDSDDVNQDTIYTVYELFYNANSDKTTAIVRLHFGGPTGTLLEANDPASVTFNGDPLPYSVLYSGHAKEYAGKITAGTFNYTNTENQTFVNPVSYMDTVNFMADFDTIVKSEANTFTWVGNPLQVSERMNLYVGTWTWGQDAAFFAFGQGQTNIIMGVNQLNNLAEGNSTCYLDRIHEVQISQGTAEGGVVRTRYRPLNKQVVIVP